MEKPTSNCLTLLRSDWRKGGLAGVQIKLWKGTHGALSLALFLLVEQSNFERRPLSNKNAFFFVIVTVLSHLIARCIKLLEFPCQRNVWFCVIERMEQFITYKYDCNFCSCTTIARQQCFPYPVTLNCNILFLYRSFTITTAWSL